MKIYVSCDMEGIGGVTLREQLIRGELLYEEARRLLTLETNAVTEALLAAGATHIVVKDAHGSGFNFIPELLHPKAEYVMGATRVENRFPGLDDSFAGALLIGYHAMGGTALAVRDHTMTSQGWQSLRLNGRPIGEIGLDALLIGQRGVPVLLVSGDDKTCMEAASELPEVAAYATKTALGRHAALLKPPQRVRSELQEAVRRAVGNAKSVKPLQLAGPYELTIRFLHTEQADARRYDGTQAERLDGLTAVYRADDLTELLSIAF
ncbi:M55 family metallopeptidase [Paenibacillus sp. GCM10027626]|uniref:M55 family metallopeptidase n=1 Tax=Paenibacillus sp. GCM10027626 TaxID=3273411 RepID=UPI00362BB817